MYQILLAAAVSQAVLPAEPIVIACTFGKLPMMLLTLREGAHPNNTLKIGHNQPVRLYAGSGLLTADYGSQEFTFSLRLPASVTVSAPGNDSITYDGDCVSTSEDSS